MDRLSAKGVRCNSVTNWLSCECVRLAKMTCTGTRKGHHVARKTKSPVMYTNCSKKLCWAKTHRSACALSPAICCQ